MPTDRRHAFQRPEGDDHGDEEVLAAPHKLVYRANGIDSTHATQSVMLRCRFPKSELSLEDKCFRKMDRNTAMMTQVEPRTMSAGGS